MRRSTVPLIALLLVAGLAPAQAATKVVQDPKGDNGRAGDILAVKVVNGTKRVKVRVTMRDLGPAGGVQVAFKYRKNKLDLPAYLASVARDETGDHREFQRNRPEVSPAYYLPEACPSFRTAWKPGKDVVLLSWRHSCESVKGNTRTMYVMVNAYYTEPGEIGGLRYFDDYTSGFRVKRG